VRWVVPLFDRVLVMDKAVSAHAVQLSRLRQRCIGTPGFAV